MAGSSVTSLGLKYLNLVFGVLMVVIFSLNIEQIVHNKRISRLEHSFDVSNNSAAQKYIETRSLDSYMANCKSCLNNAYIIMINLNCKYKSFFFFHKTYSVDLI